MTTRRKKLFFASIALALIAMLAIGGTVAYFTDMKKVLNTLGIGTDGTDKTVKITLTEPDFDSIATSGKLGDILPGDKIMKDPLVTNVGAGDVYLRVKLFSDAAATTPLTDAQMTSKYSAVFNTTDWTYHTGTNAFYFVRGATGNALAIFPTGATSSLLTPSTGTGSHTVGGKYTLSIPGSLTNADSGEFMIHVVAEVIQASGFTPGNLGSGTDPWNGEIITVNP